MKSFLLKVNLVLLFSASFIVSSPFIAQQQCIGIGTNGDRTELWDIVESSSGGFIAGGFSNNLNSGGNSLNLFATKFDNSGNQLWSTGVESSPNGREYGYAVSEAGDGSVYLCGVTRYTFGTDNWYDGKDGYIAKLSSTGTLLWTKVIGSLLVNNSSDEHFYDIQATSDGGCIVVGETEELGPGGDQAVMVVKLTASGSVSWSRNYGLNGEGVEGNKIIQIPGGYLICGGHYDGWDSALVMKISSGGGLIWAKNIGAANYNFDGEGISVDPSGNIYVSGSVRDRTGGPNNYDYNGFAAKLTSSGSLLWSKTIGGTAGNDEFHDIVADASGCHAFGHTYSYGGGSADFYLVNLNTSGSIVSTKTYGSGWDYGYAVAPKTAGGFYMSGEFGNSRSLVVEVDAAYNSCCSNSPGGTIANLGSISSWSPTSTTTVHVTQGGTGYYGLVPVINLGGSDATITPTGPYCSNAASTNLVGATAGGTWSGTGITNASLGTFDPAIAGVGTHTISYILPGVCGGSDTEDIIVTSCTPLVDSICTVIGDAARDDQGKSVLNTSDGGFIVLSNSYQSGDVDFYVVKYDAAMTVVWEQLYLADGDAYNIIETTGGDYVICGSTRDYGAGNSDAYFMKISSTGVVQWSRTIGTTSNETVHRVIENNTGGYTAVGGSYIFNLDVNGNVLWTKQVTGGSGSNGLNSLVQTSDNGYACAGYFNETFGDEMVLVVKVDVNGNYVYSKLIGVAGINQSAESIVETPSGNLVFCGEQEPSKMYLGSISANGSTLNWTRTFDGSGIERGWEVINTSDGGLASVGYTYSLGAGGADYYLVKMDASGNMQWDASYGDTGFEECFSVSQSSDGGFVLAGKSSSFGTGGTPGQVYVIKTNSLGEACCNSGSGNTEGSGGTLTSITRTTPVTTLTAGVGSAIQAITGVYTVPCLNIPVVADISASATTVCVGSSLTFTDNSTGLALNSWTWGFPTGTPSSASTQGPHTVTFNTVGTQTVTLAISDGTTSDNTSISINVVALDDATFTYAQSAFCSADTDPVATITGTSGGTFTIDNSGTINAATGEIDLTTSGNGSYVVTYTTAGTCPATSIQNITITTNPDATITGAGPFCADDASVNLTAASGGGVWSGTGITDGALGTFDPATAGAGTHTITYVISGTCGSTDTESIVVNAVDDATFTYAQSNYCTVDTDPVATISGTSGGTFTIDNGGTINAATGEIDLTTSGNGSYVVTYATAGTCPASSTQNITISTNPDATITGVGPFCADDASVNLTAASGGGTWSGVGITDGVLGTFDPATAGAGTHTITYIISGTCGSTDTESIVVNAVDDATFTYAQSNYCTVDTDPLATITGTSGGTFTIDNGGTINAATGEIDLTTSGNGSYVVTYTTAGTCPTSSTQNITISTNPDATITGAGPFCASDASVNLTAASGGGTWSGVGITDGAFGTFDPATAGAGTHTITYVISGTCGSTDTESIVVNAVDDATFTYAQSNYCTVDTDPLATITGTSGGTFTIDNGGAINAATGEVDLTTSGNGSYVVTYTTGGTCPASSTQNITISTNPDATITGAGPFCADDASVNLTAASGGGTWSGVGITDGALGTFDPATAGAGTHTITYVISGSCGTTDTESIVVNAVDDATFNYLQSAYCTIDTDPIATITGTSGGIFTINNGGTINAATGEIDLSTSGIGSYIITYTTGGTCPSSSTQNITVSSNIDATITGAGPFCADAASVNLTAANGGGTWSGTGITDASLGTFDPATAGVGTHTITYTTAGSCGTTDTEDITVNAVDDASFTYPQTSYCALSANPVATLTGVAGGTYTIDNGGAINATTGEVDLSASGTGTFEITYTTNGGCPSSATFTLQILAPDNSNLIAVDDAYDVTSNEEAILDVLTNDTYVGSNVSVIVDPLNGAYVVNTNGTISYTSTPSYVGLDSLTYVICDNVCPDLCDMAQVVITIKENVVIKVPGVFTPNGDDVNDLLDVLGLEKYPINEMLIMNRWGNKVYQTDEYHLNPWDGKNHFGVSIGGDDLPVGTYFYIFTYENLDKEEVLLKGFVYLNK